MTDATHRRALAAARGRRYRALRAKGLGAYSVKAHEQRLAEALIKSGMPHHGSRHHQRRVRCWLRQARRPDRGSGDVDQRGSAVAPQALPAVGGNAQKRGRTSIPPRRRSRTYLIMQIEPNHGAGADGTPRAAVCTSYFLPGSSQVRLNAESIA